MRSLNTILLQVSHTAWHAYPLRTQSATHSGHPLRDATAGSGRTGYIPVPPNNYPFYNNDEKYVPVMQADGGQLSGERRPSASHCPAPPATQQHEFTPALPTAEWKPMYHPTAEQAEADRKKAYELGVPHGYVAPGNKYKDLPTIRLTVLSELHTPEEYGDSVDAKGRHSGGPFAIEVSPKMRVEELRKVIMVRAAALGT